MGLLDWLTDGSLTGTDLSGSGNGSAVAQDNPMLPQTSAPPTPPPSPAPAPDPTPAAGPPDPPIDPSTQAIGGGTGAGPSPSVPMPAPRPPGADAGPIPVTPTPAASAPPAAPGAPMSLAPPAPGPSAAPYQLGGQTALGRALGINPNSSNFKEITGGLGAGLTAAGNSKGKSAGQAFASGAGGALEGANKETDTLEKQNIAYLNAAVNAQRAGDTGAALKATAAYQQGKLQQEQLEAANKDAASNKNDTPTQLYLNAQRLVQSDPEVRDASKALAVARQSGTPDEVTKAQASLQGLIQAKQAQHYAALGLHPQTAAQIAQQPGNTEKNPINAGQQGITPANISKKLQPGQYYTNPADGKVYQFKGSPTKSGSKSSSATPDVDKIKSDLEDDANSKALIKEDNE